ncbi:MAG: hypothetical protein ACOH2S_10940 [Janthinobacterium svalbardensis]
MSEKKLNIYWLDDDISRFESYKTLIEDTASEFEIDVKVITIFVDVKIYEIINSWENCPPDPAPDLFMLDHIYTEQLPHKLTGNTLAHILRRTFSEVPIVSVTAMYALPQSDVLIRDVHEYTSLIHYNELDKHFEDIYRIGLDYKLIGSLTVDEFFDKLKVPKSERSAMRLAVPMDLIVNSTPTKYSQLASWIINDLVKKPGYLVDELRAATFLGLTIVGFKKIQHRFESAKYRGPFSTNTDLRWWQSTLRDILYEITGPNGSDYSQLAGRGLSEFQDEDLCRCYVSNEIYAFDFVVAEAYPHGVWHVVRSKYATPYPNLSPVAPGFDELLIIAGE